MSPAEVDSVSHAKVDGVSHVYLVVTGKSGQRYFS